jgi:hypothetical protein
MKMHASSLWREACLSFYVGECPVFQKKLVMGQSNGSFWKKEKHKRKTTVGANHSLINRSINDFFPI